MQSLRVMTDERDALPKEIDDRKEDKDFALQQLRRICKARIKVLKSHLCIAAAERENGAKAVDIQLDVENGKLRVDGQDYVWRLGMNDKLINDLEQKCEKAEVDCRSMRRIQQQIENLEQHVKDLKTSSYELLLGAALTLAMGR